LDRDRAEKNFEQFFEPDLHGGTIMILDNLIAAPGLSAQVPVMSYRFTRVICVAWTKRVDVTISRSFGA